MLEKLTNKYIELYMELAKVNKNKFVSAHIMLDTKTDGDLEEYTSVFLDIEAVMLIIAGREPKKSYFSFQIDNEVGYTKSCHLRDMKKDVAINLMNKIIKEMEFTLELWMDANEN